jgi:hypothetical protein
MAIMAFTWHLHANFEMKNGDGELLSVLFVNNSKAPGAKKFASTFLSTVYWFPNAAATINIGPIMHNATKCFPSNCIACLKDKERAQRLLPGPLTGNLVFNDDGKSIGYARLTSRAPSTVTTTPSAKIKCFKPPMLLLSCRHRLHTVKKKTYKT